MRMYAQEERVDESKVYAWVDHACIDQGSWAKYPDIGMAYVCESSGASLSLDPLL